MRSAYSRRAREFAILRREIADTLSPYFPHGAINEFAEIHYRKSKFSLNSFKTYIGAFKSGRAVGASTEVSRQFPFNGKELSALQIIFSNLCISPWVGVSVRVRERYPGFYMPKDSLDSAML